MTPLAEACTDLQAWLPHAHALIAEPDTQPITGRTQPTSTPPWNTDVANALLDIHAGVRELEQDLRYQVTGRCRTRGGSDANTIRAIGAIPKLAEATGETNELVARIVSHWVNTIMALPAFDLTERWRQLPAPCPRCSRPMLYARPRTTGEVRCAGCANEGRIRPGTVSDGCIEWSDGVIT